MNVNGKLIWITGASSGIGEALAKRLADMGSRLILSARRESELQRVISECAFPERHVLQILDLERSGDFAQITVDLEERLGAIDMLVNNGGISQRSNGLETLETVERRIMEVNYFGTVALTRAMLEPMLKRNAGIVLTIGSVNGKIGSPNRTTYAASKHAIMGYMDSLRVELKNSAVKICVVSPGFVRTNIAKNALCWDGQPFGETDDVIRSGMEMDYFIEKLLRVIRRGDEEAVIAQGISLTGYWVHRLSPNLYHWLLKKFAYET